MENSAEKNENITSSEKNTDSTQAAKAAASEIVRRFTLESIWPSDKEDFYKNMTFRMANELADLFGKQVIDVSIADVNRATNIIPTIFLRQKVSESNISSVKKLVARLEKAGSLYSFLSHTYTFGSLFAGNFAPIIRKLGVKVSGEPLARATGIWIVGTILTEIYWDVEKFSSKRVNQTDSFDPVFDSLNIDQLRELTIYLGIDAKVRWNEVELRESILSCIQDAQKGVVVASIVKSKPRYLDLLLDLSEELQIPNYSPSDDIKKLETRIVYKVFAETTEKLSPSALAQFEHTILRNTDDNYWASIVKSGGLMTTLLAGRAAGFGLYIAASSGLAALTNGLGFTMAFSTYSSMSTALAYVFGPVGIGAAGAWTAWHTMKPRPKKALPLVLYIALLRSSIESGTKRKRNWTARLKAWLSIRFYSL